MRHDKAMVNKKFGTTKIDQYSKLNDVIGGRYLAYWNYKPFILPIEEEV